MAWASQSGRARTSAKNPQAFAVCMRCGMWENRVNLQFQYDWAGAQLQNKYLLVCKHCLDVPQEQLRAITLPADPVPIYFPSIENFAQDETDYHTVNAVPTTDSIGLPVPPGMRPRPEIRASLQPQRWLTHMVWWWIPTAMSSFLTSQLPSTAAFASFMPVI